MKLGLCLAGTACCIMLGCGSSASVGGTPDCNAHFDDSDWGQGYGEQVQLPASTSNVNLDNCVPINGWYCCVSNPGAGINPLLP